MKIVKIMAVAAVAMFTASLANPAEAKSDVTCFKGDRVAQCPVAERVKTSRTSKRVRHARSRTDANGNSVSTSGLVSPLLAKVNEIKADCGSIVVSAYRPGARIPTGQLSNHARHMAADLKGNPACIYSHLHGWKGGYSTDYHSAPGGPHVHISYNPGGMEWGVRFAHHHGKHRHRVAMR